MKKFSVEWKKDRMEKDGGWAQKHEADRYGNAWKWHYIQNETEYTESQSFRLMRECEAAHGC